MIRHHSRSSTHSRLAYSTIQLWEKMVSPLCGILTTIYAYHRQTYDPKGITLGGELTNVALYKGITSKINYHIGGMGFSREDAMIKCLAESYERYAPVMFDPERRMTCCFDSYTGIITKFPNDFVPSPSLFRYFNEKQLSQENFFREFNINNPMLWVKAREIVHDDRLMWVPAHLLFFGYLPKNNQGEYRINSAVSTGTAVHTSLTPCLYNSMMEMIMIDAVIGHWYTNHSAYKIELSDRTRHIQKIVDKALPHQNLNIEFYWIPSIDFPIFNIACVVRSESIPKVSIGLGSDHTLEGAMYKAFIEFIGTRFLSNTLAVLQSTEVDFSTIKNFDDNVLYYALGHGAKKINERFNTKQKLNASSLPPDMSGNKHDVINVLLKKFSETEKQVVLIDFTNAESKELGLVATKLWSPQLITVPMPFAIPVLQQRFTDYGGVAHVEPHPYP